MPVKLLYLFLWIDIRLMCVERLLYIIFSGLHLGGGLDTPSAPVTGENLTGGYRVHGGGGGACIDTVKRIVALCLCAAYVIEDRHDSPTDVQALFSISQACSA